MDKSGGLRNHRSQVQILPREPDMAYASTEQQRLYAREHYKRNKAKHIEQSKIRTIKHRKVLVEFINEYKSKHACIECGEKDPICLDFHHVSKDKDIEIANAVRRGWSLKRVETEIGKCVVVCANCHRKLHYRERLEG